MKNHRGGFHVNKFVGFLPYYKGKHTKGHRKAGGENDKSYGFAVFDYKISAGVVKFQVFVNHPYADN